VGSDVGVLTLGLAVGVGCSGPPVWPGSTMFTTPSVELTGRATTPGSASSVLTNTRLRTPVALGWNVIVATAFPPLAPVYVLSVFVEKQPYWTTSGPKCVVSALRSQCVLSAGDAMNGPSTTSTTSTRLPS